MKLSEPKEAKASLKRMIISVIVTRLLKREDSNFTKILIDTANASAPVYEQSANFLGCEVIYFYNTTKNVNGKENLLFLN